MSKNNHTVVSLLSNEGSEDLSIYLVTVITAMVQKHKLPWSLENKKTGCQIRDAWGKFILNDKNPEVGEKIKNISNQLWERWENEFPDDIKKITKVWDIIEKENKEIENALKLEHLNRFQNVVIR
jgi:hypothetical protein